jgi:ribosomal protein S18 acetylase RimI-like enzyme
MAHGQVSSRSLMQAAEECPREFFRTMLDSGFHTTRKADWIISGVPEAFFNPVLRTEFSRAAARDIERMMERYDSSGSSMSWQVTPSSRPKDLGDKLVAYGFKLEGTAPAMALSLKDLKRQEYPEGISVRRVGNRRELGKWFALWTRIFGIPYESRDPLYRFFLQKGWRSDSDVYNYEGFLKGRLVAISTLHLGRRAVGIYNVGTVESARGRGIGTAMTHYALEEGRRRGYEIGTLQASKAGYGVYRKLGFEELFKVRNYVRRRD